MQPECTIKHLTLSCHIMGLLTRMVSWTLDRSLAASPLVCSAILCVCIFGMPLCILPACLYLPVGVEYGLLHFDRSAALGAALSCPFSCLYLRTHMWLQLFRCPPPPLSWSTLSLWGRFCWGAGAAHRVDPLIFYVVFAFVPLCIVPACLYLPVGVEYGLVHFDRSAALGAALSLVCACIP